MKTLMLHEETNELISVTQSVPVRDDYESISSKLQMKSVDVYCALVDTDKEAAEKAFFDEHRKLFNYANTTYNKR